MDAKMMFPWMRWMSRLHNCNRRSQTKMVPHFQRRKKFLMEVNKFLLQLLMLPCYWEKHTDCWP
ncbi:hypothetical protein Gogos_015244 [Gossypium gossypioides]|uniref:Uncharacterized protein n=1 Tax=Gossypium gossypioides TaxID=34282 RepID=A0A7J9C1M2_GOSGO|nr:hypothetical protein [Gossypium gossypioides]